MMDKVLLAGFGGQGVMFIGKILAYAAMLGNLEVCWIPSYGPEMRGGTANCSVILSDEEIHSPVIDQADAGIVLNKPSFDKFLTRIRPGGVLVVNSSIVEMDKTREDIEIIAIPAGDIANEIGNANLANMVCLGALLPKLKLVSLEKIEKALDEVVGKKKPELYEWNLTATKKGLES
jgi:2-oxoglutarate ferredoxin oxidoreductase subunit gamma